MNILVTGARAPIAADIARVLAACGHRVYTTDSLHYPVGRAAPGIAGYLRLPAPATHFADFEEQLGAACRRHAIERIIPTSEEVFWLAQVDGLPPGCALSTSNLGTLEELHHKGHFATLANLLGVGPGPCRQLGDAAQLRQFAADHDTAEWVFKRVYSRFATDVRVGPSPAEVGALPAEPDNPWLAQPRVQGPEVCLYNICQDGRVLLHLAYRPVYRAGAGASVYFEPLHDTALRTLSERMARATRFSGQLSFDVIQSTRGPVAIECNPRGTSGVHLAAQYPHLLAAALMGQPVELPRLAPRMLALPLLACHPGLLLGRAGRRAFGAARDALGDAGVSLPAQACAMGEVLWRAARSGTPLLASTTGDIEWNGVPVRRPGAFPKTPGRRNLSL
jgi:hypothetical protein